MNIHTSSLRHMGVKLPCIAAAGTWLIKEAQEGLSGDEQVQKPVVGLMSPCKGG